MKTINLRNGKISGKWNEKFYEPKPDNGGKPWVNKVVKRIYVDEVQWHITQKEYDNLLDSKEAVTKETQSEIEKLFSKLDRKGKFEILGRLAQKADLPISIERSFLGDILRILDKEKVGI